MTKEQLRQYVRRREEMEQLLQRIECLRRDAASLRSPRLDGLPKAGGVHSSVEAAVIRLVHLEEVYAERMDAMAAEQQTIEDAIESLEPTERMLMRARYLDGMKWEEVCVRIGYSWQQTHRIHARALEKLAQ